MRILALLLTLTAVVESQADLLTWTNTSNGNWNVPLNWSPHQVPSTNDIAVITNAGTYTVTLNVNPTLAGLVIGGDNGTQTLATAGHTLTLNGSGMVNRRGEFLLSGGALSGTNQVAIAGVLAWEYGAIDTNAVVVVNADGQVTIASGATHAKFLYGSLTNSGTITWRPVGNFNIGGTLHNLAGGVFEAQLDAASMLKAGADAVIINEGVFRKAVGGGNLSCSVPVINSGRIDSQTGTLSLLDGSSLRSGSTFTGAGVTRLNTGTHTLNGTICATNLVLTGGDLAGDATLIGTITWSYGTLNQGASLTIATNSALVFTSAPNFVKTVNGNLTNAGTVIWQPLGRFELAGVIHNLPGGLFDVQVDNTSMLKASGAARLINEGLLRKSPGSYRVHTDVPTSNSGTVEIFPGELEFGDVFTHAAGTIALAGGALRTSQALYLASGELTGWGAVNAQLINGGCLRPSASNGVLTVNGNYQQLLSGSLELDVAGNLPGTNQSRLLVTGAATLHGTVAVHWDTNYLAEPGTNFQVLTFAARDGEFCCLDHFILPGQGRRLLPLYSSTNLVLATIAAPEPTDVPLRVAVDGAALICWPAEFPGCELFWSTNLGQPGWVLIPGLTNRYFEFPPLAREKFFRLRQP